MSTLVPYRILTERLCLRPWEFHDVHALHEAIVRNREHLGPWLPWAAEERTLGTSLEFVRRARAEFDADEQYVLGVFDRVGEEIRGGAGLHRRSGAGGLEIGYWIDQAHVGQGLATELTAGLARVALEVLAMSRVEVRVSPGNEPSLRIPHKLGFVEEGVLRRRVLHFGEWIDLTSFVLTPDDLPSSPAAAYPVEAFDALGRPLLEA